MFICILFNSGILYIVVLPVILHVIRFYCILFYTAQFHSTSKSYHPLGPHNGHAILNSIYTIWNFPEIIFPKSYMYKGCV